MGKSYVENSLKRFLKRKVKITLGLVVAFMITGAVAFAEGTTENHFVEHNKDFITAEEYLAGLNSNSNKLSNLMKDFQNVSNQTEGIELDKNNNKVTLVNFKKDGNIEISLNNENISNVTAQNIKTALEKGASNINNISKTTLAGGTNNGIILNTSNNGINGESINNGIISSGRIGQEIGASKTATNNGIITSTTGGQVTESGNLSILCNNGIIYNHGSVSTYSTGNTQAINGSSKNSTAINNGILINGRQVIKGGHSNQLYNYGIIENSHQVITNYLSNNVKENYAYNYGIIKSGDKSGQIISKNGEISQSILKNYGFIDGNGQKIEIGTENTAENYGVIKTGATGTAISIIGNTNKGFNYGTVIVNTENATINQQNPVKVFEGDVVNKGLVILDNYTGTDLTNIALGNKNNGLVFKKNNGNYSLINTNTAAEITDKNISNNKFNGKTTAYVTGTGNKITENLSDKVIGTIVKDGISKTGAVITADNDITLEDTVITGYFENNGTLLDMGTNNLTLLGDTKLVASKNNFGLTDVNALNINGRLKMIGNVEIAGKITGEGTIHQVAVNGEEGKGATFENIDIEEVLLQNAKTDEEKYLEGTENSFTNITFNNLTTNQVILDFEKTAEKKENTITFTDNLLIEGKDGVAVDGRGTLEGNNININFSSLDNEKVQGDILLGASDDDIVVEKNGVYKGTIDMGEGNDSFTVNGFAQSTTKADNHKELGTFDYKLAGVETITLKGDGIKTDNGWHIGENAEIISKGENGTKLIIDNEQLHVDMNNNYGKGNVTTSLDKLAGENGANGLVLETSKDEKTGKDTGLVKFVVGDKFDVSQKQFDVAHSYSVAGANLGTAVIFKGTGKDGAVEEKDGKISLTVKEASEVGLSGYEGIYNAVLKGLSKDDDLRNAVNYSKADDLVYIITTAGKTAEAFYTTGYAVTKDVTDTYMSVVEDFGRKAGKGEWIAYGKYVNSDTEFDGGKSSKGYDGDITGTVGMIEYGVNETTSYGVVYGQGDTEVDIQGGGKLDGDNTYFGGYVKHRTQNGIDLTGNIGITKSELDLSLATNTKTQGGVNHHIITDGNSDADALTFSIKGTKDYKVTDTIRLQPVVSGRYSFISQDEVTSSDANFKMDEQDITIFEGAFGGNIIKDFDIYNGRLSLSAGAEYVLTDVNKDDNARYHLYNENLHFTGEEDIADNRIEGHIGIDYEHESGVGVDAKYEMIWTDKGDNSRVTAGISYKF